MICSILCACQTHGQKGIDNADLEQSEVIVYPGDFLIGAVTNYDFTPYNTTTRVEDGQIVEMNRVFIP